MYLLHKVSDKNIQCCVNVARCVVWNVVCCESCSSDIARIVSCDFANDAARNNCLHWCLRCCKWWSAQELRASLQLNLREVLQAFIVACDIANDAGCYKLYSVQKAYIAAVSHDADCVSCWTLCCVRCQQASWCVLCSTRFIHLTKSLLFFLDLVTLVAIAVMVQCLAQEYGSSKLLQKCLVSRISPFSSTPAHNLAEDSSVKVPSHYRSGWKETYR